MATTCKLIAKNVLGSDTASVTFSSIPGTGYTDLLLLSSARTARTGAVFDSITVAFNSSSSNYSYRLLRGSGSAAASFNASSGLFLQACSSDNTASTFANGEMYVPNYAGSTAKSVSSTTVQETNASEAYIFNIAGLWNDTAAITSISLTPVSETNFKSGSSFFLYGITKSA